MSSALPPTEHPRFRELPSLAALVHWVDEIERIAA